MNRVRDPTRLQPGWGAIPAQISNGRQPFTQWQPHSNSNPDMVTAQIGTLLLAVLLVPQRQDQASLKRKLEQKRSGARLKSADWILDYEKARAKSRKTGKPIFAYFARSYAW